MKYWLLQYPLGWEPTENLLSPEEIGRAARFHFPLDAARYRYFHHRMREILSESLPDRPAPDLLNFEIGPHGKPVLVDHPEFHFNLTHSHDHAAVAISDSPVGIDLEVTDETFPCREVARQYFCGDEISAVLDAPNPALTTERFYAFWTAKEAIMKATGLGMTLEPQRIQLAVEDGFPCGIEKLDYPGLVAADWKLHRPTVAPGLALAVVTRCCA